MAQGKRRADWLDQVLAFLPPRLHRWFARKWAEPAAWHSARLAFARTAAVWSMVGHICGLGDRHGARRDTGSMWDAFNANPHTGVDIIRAVRRPRAH